MIKSKLEIIDKNTVIQHRRLVTPFFYVNLKSITYTHSSHESHYIYIPTGLILSTFIPIPGNKTQTMHVWTADNNKTVPGKLCNKLKEITDNA